MARYRSLASRQDGPTLRSTGVTLVCGFIVLALIENLASIYLLQGTTAEVLAELHFALVLLDVVVLWGLWTMRSWGWGLAVLGCVASILVQGILSNMLGLVLSTGILAALLTIRGQFSS